MIDQTTITLPLFNDSLFSEVTTTLDKIVGVFKDYRHPDTCVVAVGNHKLTVALTYEEAVNHIYNGMPIATNNCDCDCHHHDACGGDDFITELTNVR